MFDHFVTTYAHPGVTDKIRRTPTAGCALTAWNKLGSKVASLFGLCSARMWANGRATQTLRFETETGRRD